MSTPIGQIPQGLLSLLGLRDFGAVPRLLDGTIQSGVDLTQFLLLNREVIVGTTTGITGLGSFHPAETLVPAGELWYIHSASARSATLPAGDTLTMMLSYGLNGQNILIGDPMSATGGGQCATFAKDFWLPAGGNFNARVMQITTATSLTVVVGAIITRLRI